MLALAEAIWHPMTRVLIISASHRQSRLTFEAMKLYHTMLGQPSKFRVTKDEMELKNMSRIVCLPSKEATIRGYNKIDFVIIDEAARVPDDVYRAVRPMLATTEGRLILLSTPYGRRGFFYNEWASGAAAWHRIEIPVSQCPRISAKFLEEERRALGASWFRQEYECSFESVEVVVYPEFARCVVEALPDYVIDVKTKDPGPPKGTWEHHYSWEKREPLELLERSVKRVGGLDFGFRNPFAAVWGVVDRDDVLWLTGEHYASEKPLVYHAEHLPRGMMWYADPSGAGDIDALIRANFKVRQGLNDVRLGSWRSAPGWRTAR